MPPVLHWNIPNIPQHQVIDPGQGLPYRSNILLQILPSHQIVRYQSDIFLHVPASNELPLSHPATASDMFLHWKSGTPHLQRRTPSVPAGSDMQGVPICPYEAMPRHKSTRCMDRLFLSGRPLDKSDPALNLCGNDRTMNLPVHM